MTISIKKLAFIGAIALFITSCSLQNKLTPTNDMHNAKISLDWEGYYYGVIPCASCPGIKILLHLYTSDTSPKYTLFEQYIEEDTFFKSSGDTKWIDTTFLQLKDKLVFVGENFISLVGKDKKINQLYNLEKLDLFGFEEEKLYVQTSTLKEKTIKNQTLISFDSILTFNATMEGGHKSLEAKFDINCKTKQYTIPNITYYKNNIPFGEILEKIDKNENPPLSFRGKNDVLFKAAQAYCPNI